MSSSGFTTQVIQDDGTINFGIGQPDPTILPLKIMKQATAHQLGLGDTGLLNYGFELGDGRFRQALADLLTKHHAKAVSSDELFATSGASNALDLICTRFTKSGDTILVEEPTYFLVHQIFEDHNLNVIGVPFDENGYDFEALEVTIKAHHPKFFYTIPVFQNPASHCIPFAQKEVLVEMSKQHDFLIVADEVYQMLGYTKTPPPPFANLIDSGTVISIGSFSKILGPGLRLGWIQAAPEIVQQFGQLGMVVSGGAVNHFTSNLVTSVMTLGLQADYLQTLKQTYGQRIELMDGLLRNHFGAQADEIYQKPGGGFFFWLTLPKHINTSDLAQQALAKQVKFQPGVNFSVNGRFKNCLRLSFAYYGDAEIMEGMGRLFEVLR